MSDPETFPNILIVRTDRIGDVLLTLPMAAVLKKKYPRARVTMLVREYTKPLLVGYPDVDEIIAIQEEKDISSIVPTLKQKHFSSVYCPSPSFAVARAMQKAGIPVRIGTAYRWYSSLFFTQLVRDHRKYAQYHEAVCNVRMIDQTFPATPETLPLHVSLNENARAAVRAWLDEKGIMGAAPYAIVHPGSGGSAKDWNPERFA
ncbi:MAG TPA: hypothetical protein VFA55_00695, partial [Candidatus Kapabacteria bacterium]|nr:hypothetical protein [Candidatus Kapabacteria bacterium]